MTDPHPETAAAIATLAAEVATLKRDREEIREWLTEVADDLRAIRRTTDKASGHWAAITLIVGPAIGALTAAFAAWLGGILHFKP